MQHSAYILNALRTPIGSSFKSLKNFTAGQLGAVVIREIVRRQKVKKDAIEEVIFGNTVGAGTGQNLARQAAVAGGLAVSTPAYTVNNVCGAGLQSTFLAVQAIQSANASLILAGGAESATHCPRFLTEAKSTGLPVDLAAVLARGFMPRASGDPKGRPLTALEKSAHPPAPQESLAYDGLFCQISGQRMGDLAEWLARDSNISRQEQDQFSLESQQKAVAAQAQGKFRKEIVPIKIFPNEFLKEDERPRTNIKIKTLASLPAAFIKEGSVTAGNSSIPSDGAAAVLVGSETIVKRHHSRPLAKILSFAAVAVEPHKVFTAAVPAIEKCLKRCQLSLKDIDLFEISEAFAVQAIYAQQKLDIPQKKINIYGGDIALGHPLGAAGTRILVTLTHALIQEGKQRGLACICLGGGGGLAIIIERVN